MLANDVSDVLRSVAYIVGAIALLVIAIGVMWALLHQHRVSASIESKLGHLDLAVNGVTGLPDDPPLVEKVRRIERTLDRLCVHLSIPTHSESEAA